MKHGMRNTSIYNCWISMRNRCYNKNNQAYKYYGARGIEVCDRWNNLDNGFTNFCNDMGPKPDGKYSIDRIDNNSNYTPENCKWSSLSEQNSNKRTWNNNAKIKCSIRNSGENNPNSKIDNITALKIKKLLQLNIGATDISRIIGCSLSIVNGIKYRNKNIRKQ